MCSCARVAGAAGISASRSGKGKLLPGHSSAPQCTQCAPHVGSSCSVVALLLAAGHARVCMHACRGWVQSKGVSLKQCRVPRTCARGKGKRMKGQALFSHPYYRGGMKLTGWGLHASCTHARMKACACTALGTHASIYMPSSARACMHAHA